MMTPSEKIIASNFPHCNEWSEKSFCGQLHEESIWDAAKYESLRKALDEITAQYLSSGLPFNLNRRINRIFSFLFMTLRAHIDPNDRYRITNLSQEDFYAKAEDLHACFERLPGTAGC